MYSTCGMQRRSTCSLRKDGNSNLLSASKVPSSAETLLYMLVRDHADTTDDSGGAIKTERPTYGW